MNPLIFDSRRGILVDMRQDSHEHESSIAANKASKRASSAESKARNYSLANGPDDPKSQHLWQKMREAHREAGLAHLEATKHTAGQIQRDHQQKAERHAGYAGSEWDEEKHPRGEDGRFA